jgi:hypothetical protein
MCHQHVTINFLGIVELRFYHDSLHQGHAMKMESQAHCAFADKHPSESRHRGHPVFAQSYIKPASEVSSSTEILAISFVIACCSSLLRELFYYLPFHGFSGESYRA